MSISDITKFTSENLAGLESIRIVHVSDVISIPRAGTDRVIVDAVEFSDGAGWTDIYCTRETIRVQEKPSNDEHGISYIISVSGSTPRDSAALIAQLDNMEERLYIVLGRDNNGVEKIYGSLDFPLELSTELDTQASVDDRAGYEVSFRGESPVKAYAYAPVSSGSGSAS